MFKDQTLKGKMRITYPHGNTVDHVCIEVIDELSHCQILEVNCSYEALARMLSNREQECTYSLQNVEVAGKVYEWKEVSIPKRTDKTLYDKNEIYDYISKHVNQYEVDGWVADIQRTLNSQSHHGVYRVLLNRFVTKEQKDEQATS